jgi:hypothetical protein
MAEGQSDSESKIRLSSGLYRKFVPAMKHGLGRNENGGKKTGALSARLLFVSLLQ